MERCGKTFRHRWFSFAFAGFPVTMGPRVNDEDAMPSGHPLLAGLRAARRNLVPALILQAVLLLLLAAYFWHPPTGVALGVVADWRREAGYGFVLVASIVGSALLPELFRIACFQRGRPERRNLSHLAFSIPFWAFIGVAVDTLYRAQAMLFGAEADFATVVCKVAVDQFLVSPLGFMPFTALMFEWRHHGYDWRAVTRNLTPAFYRDRVLPIQVAAWTVWIPGTAIIYTLPLLLQVPVYVLANCYWVLVLTYVHHERASAVSLGAGD